MSFKLQFKSMTLFPNLVNSFWTRMNRLRMFCCQLIKKSLILLGNMHPSAYNWIKDSLFNYSIKILAQENLTSFFQKYLSHTLIKLFLHQAKFLESFSTPKMKNINDWRFCKHFNIFKSFQVLNWLIFLRVIGTLFSPIIQNLS